MIFEQKAQPRGKYKSHPPELKNIVARTGDLQLALDHGVARSTARYWISNAKISNILLTSSEKLLQEELEQKKLEIQAERLKLQFLQKLAPYLEYVRNNKRRVSRKIKKIFIDTIENFQKHCPIISLLKLIGMNSSRYYKWKSEIAGCTNSSDRECGVKRQNQLTRDEVMIIRKYISLPKYLHFSLTALWKFCYRNGLVVCSRDTWFKYVNKFNIDRGRIKKIKVNYTKGVRAANPNEIWHLDLTIFTLTNGVKVYLQAIIDNFSRYIVDFELSTEKTGINTAELLKRAYKKMGNKKIDVLMDKGSENKNSFVNQIILGSNLLRVFAKTDVVYSNSMVEAFFRSIKNNFLYLKKIKTIEHLKKLVRFYIKEHNGKIPHSAFKFSTPEEIYQESWTKDKEEQIEALKIDAILKRKEHNQNLKKCYSCLV